MNASQADYLMSLKEIEKLKAQRDALLEALGQIAEMDRIDAALDPQWAVRVARAAIAKAEGV
jgi:hypothetical protein